MIEGDQEPNMSISQKESAAHLRSCELGCLSSEELGKLGPFAAMTLIHDKKVALCEELENIADCLPSNVDELTCLSVAAKLLPILRLAHEYEESVIFPTYEKAVADTGQNMSIDRLRGEHISDECFAADLTGILLKIGHGGYVDQAETFRFMLRGFFYSLRRHVAFENEHVVPIIRKSTLSHPNRF
ncbi:hemerythrin domain-containing protein [Rhizobium sp. RCAM05350]|nr:hemerythrin domain-containing protein [Rhizobium sp. RCAM05350]